MAATTTEKDGGHKKKLSLKKCKASSTTKPTIKETAVPLKANIHCCAGLMNLGNTCYINTTVQALYYTPGLVEHMNQGIYDSESIGYQLASLFFAMKLAESNEICAVNPSKLVHKLQSHYFEAGHQHDSQECLNLLLDNLTASIRGRRKRKTSESVSSDPAYKKTTTLKISDFFTPKAPSITNAVTVKTEPLPVPISSYTEVDRLFQGLLLLETICLTCERAQSYQDPFTHLTLPVTRLDGAGNCGAYSLTWSLSRFASVEYLRHDNKYFCRKCRHLTEAKHTIAIDRLPEVVVIHLNRFSTKSMQQTLSTSLSVSKAMGNIAIPLSIAFSDWCTSSCVNKDIVYQLYSVILHTGSSCYSGHYTTLVRKSFCDKDSSNSNWILFDDEKITEITSNQVVSLLSPLPCSSTPYILFYWAKS